MEDKNVLIEEMLERLRRLRFLARPTIAFLERVFRDECSMAELRHHESQGLRTIEKIGENLAQTPHLFAFAERISELDEADLLREFEMEKVSFYDWMRAFRREVEPSRNLYCCCNMMASLVMVFGDDAPSPNVAAIQTFQQAHYLADVFEDRQAALEILEGWLELTTERYGEPGLREHFERRFEGILTDTAVRIMITLAECLRVAKRDPHLVLVLESFLGLKNDDYDDREGMKDFLDRWQESGIENLTRMVSENRSESPLELDELIRGGSGFCNMYCKLLFVLGYGLLRQKRASQGVDLCGAYFGIWPDSLESFETFQRRSFELGEEAFSDRLNSWTSLVGHAGQLDLLRRTYQNAFGSVSEEPEDFTEPRRQPHPRWFNGDGDAAASLWQALGSRLSDKNTSQIVDLYESCAGVSEIDFDHPDGRLSFWISGVEPVHAVPVILQVAWALFLAGRFDHLVSLLEDHYGITGEDYLYISRTRAHFRQRQGRQINRSLNVLLLMLWSHGLSSTNRVIEAAGLLEILYPGLSDVEDKQGFKEFFQDCSEQPSATGELLIWNVSRILFQSTLVRESRMLIEAYLGIESESDYGRTGEELGRIIREKRLISSANLERLVGQLAQCLAFDDRPQQAISLFEAYLGIDEESYRDHSRLQERFRTLSRDTAWSLPTLLAFSHEVAGTPERGVAVIEALLEIRTIDEYKAWNVNLPKPGPQYAERPMVDWEASLSLVELVYALLDSLKTTGQTEKYQALLEQIDRERGWLDAPSDFALISTLMVVGHLLGFLLERDPERCLELCLQSVSLLRDRSNRENLSSLDRVRFANFSMVFRRGLVELGNSMILLEADPACRDRLRVQFLQWDAELGQRNFLERLMMSSPSLNSDGADAPIPDRAYNLSVRYDEFPSVNEVVPGCYDRQPDLVPLPVSNSSPSGLPVFGADGEEFADSLREGVGEARLAEVLGDHQLLLRAGFTNSGRLVWSLFARDGDRLETRCSGQTEIGEDARSRITQAIRKHDEAIRQTWEQPRLQQKWDELSRLVASLGKMLKPGLNVSRGANKLDKRLQEHNLNSIRERLWNRFPWLSPLGDGVARENDLEDWNRYWDQIAAERIEPETLDESLDRATADLTEEIASAWPLHELAAELDRLSWMDLIVQFDDVLHSVPIALLKVDGRYLFERVRSIRSVLSLAMIDFLGRVDRRTLNATLDLPDKVLSLSWFESGDLGARRGAEMLHEGHREILESHRKSVQSEAEWYSAADSPPGTYACLARGLEMHGPFRVVSVCGHGRSDFEGIELGDGVWNGSSLWESHPTIWRRRDACDLAGVEFLIQLSCSIGRMRQSELQDVEGFCVELAVSRARSILAGLWPLHTVHSPRFVNLVVENYLRLRSEAVDQAKADFAALSEASPGLSDDPSLRTRMITTRLAESLPRSRAVAEARHHWLEENRRQEPPLGLNTIAAFELYGLG